MNPVAGQSYTYTRTFSVANQGAAGNPITAFIDKPTGGASVSGVFALSGWAVSTADAVANVQLLIDGKSFGSASYGGIRPDVCAAYPSTFNCPNVGWSASLVSSQFTNGNHVLEATITTSGGHRASVGTTFTVANTTSGPGHIYFDVPIVNGSAAAGSVTFAGWALNDNAAVSSLSVTIDGVPYGTANYHIPRPDVCALYPGRQGCPNVGWTFPFDTTQIADGTHILGLTENNADGTF